VRHRRPWPFGPCRYRQPRLRELLTFTPRHGRPCSSRRIVLFGTIRRDQDSAARNAPRCVHWSPGRLSPLGLGTRRRIAPRGEPRAATTERASPRGRFRHVCSRARAARQVRFGLADLTHRMSPNGCCQSSELRAHHEHPQPWRSHWPATTTRRPAREQGGRYSPSRGRAPFLGPAAPASTTARRRGFTPEEVWLGHPLSPVDAGLRWKSARPAAVRKTAS
jgi:hypothetical protein